MDTTDGALVHAVMGRAVYRTRQFVRALTSPFAGRDLEAVERLLSPAQQELFLRMPRTDQRHAVAVCRALEEQDVRSLDLLVAALLHDVGKVAAHASLWVRVAVVLLERLAPTLLGRLSHGVERGWRRSFVVYRRHPGIGAEWAEEAGSSSLAVALIRRHGEAVERPLHEEDRLLGLLNEADESW